MKFPKLLVALLATFTLVGCEEPQPNGPIDDSENNNEQPVGGYQIQIDKDTIEADGVDCVTFSVLDAEGNDILVNADGSDSDLLPKTYFVMADSGKRLERATKTFSAIKNGEYTFYATVRGERTSNTVTIKVQNRSVYEQFLQKVCVYQLTATWCGYCPQMTEALGKLRTGEYGDNVIVMATHADDVYALPWSNKQGYDLGTYVLVSFGGSGYPYAVYDMSFGSGQRTESMLNSFIERQLLTNPSTCGVKISSATMDGQGNTTITASVKAAKDGVYDLGYAVLADNQPSQGGSESKYNDVVAAVSDNFIKMSNDTKVELKAGEEFTKTFEFKVERFDGATFNVTNYKVVAFAHSAANGGMIDNANTCAIGKSVDYILNE